jgi:hypothetical protein
MNIINKVYKGRILKLVQRLEFGTPERLRQEYMVEYKGFISWATIKRHLEILTEEKLIKKQLISAGKKRSIIIYLKEGKKIK